MIGAASTHGFLDRRTTWGHPLAWPLVVPDLAAGRKGGVDWSDRLVTAAFAPEGNWIVDMEIRLRVDGTQHRLVVDTRTTLLDARRANSCLALAVAHQDTDIVTAAGLADGQELHPLQRAFIDHDAFQCGYCTPGQLCSAVGMLQEAQAGWPSAVSRDLDADEVVLEEAEIAERMSGNLCRCAAYANIVPAIREVAGR